MITPFDLEAGVKGQIPHLGKTSQAMIPYGLFSCFEVIEPIIRAI